MYGNTTKFTEQPHPQYDGMSTVKIQGCTGYTSWNNSRLGYQDYQFQEPQDIGCLDEPFDFVAWNTSGNAAFEKGMIQAAYDRNGAFHYDSMAFVINIILATMYHNSLASSISSYNSTALPDACRKFSDMPGRYYVADSFVFGHSTGMTIVGIILQAFAPLSVIIALVLLAWPTFTPRQRVASAAAWADARHGARSNTRGCEGDLFRTERGEE
jgi:hypothetical protein